MLHFSLGLMLVMVVEGSSPPGLVFPKLYNRGEMVQVNDPRGVYKQFFSGQQVYGEQQWTFRVSTTRYGTDFIAFFATDNARPLEYSCAFSPALCDFTVTKGAHDPETYETIVYAHLRKPLLFPSPSMSGYLMLCIGRADMLWKRPLIGDYEVQPLWRKGATDGFNVLPARYFCQSLQPGKQKEIIKVPPPKNRKTLGCERFEGYSCFPGLLIKPDPRAINTPELEVHTWYMTKENYRDMRVKNLAQVFVPMLPKLEHFTLPLYGTIGFPVTSLIAPWVPGEVCSVTTPFQRKVSVRITNRELNQFQFPIRTYRANSGVYVVACSFQVYDQVAGVAHSLEVKKSLNITFIRGPKIVLEGQSDYIKYFSPSTSTAYVLVLVYTTSPLTSFTVTSVAQYGRDDSSTDVFPSFVSSSPYEIVWRHSIRVPMPDLSANGLYEIEVVNKEREVASQTFKIHKAELLKVVVSPKSLAVEVGAKARFECAGVGNLVEDVRWTREVTKFSDYDTNVVVTSVRYIGAESSGKRLVVHEARLNDSGIYECTVSNRYQTVMETATLVVWPHGGPFMTYNDDADKPHAFPSPSHLAPRS